MDARIRLILGLTSSPNLISLSRNNVGTFWVYRFCNKSNVAFIFSKNGCAGCEIPIYVGSQIIQQHEPREKRLSCSAISTIHPRFETNIKNLMEEHELEPQNILVVHDDLNIETGKVRYTIGSNKGSATGHLGLQALYNVLKTNQIHHLQLGIGLIENQDPRQVLSYLQDSPSFIEKDKIERAIDFSFMLVPTILKGQYQVAQNIMNTRDLTLEPEQSLYIDSQMEKEISEKKSHLRPRI